MTALINGFILSKHQKLTKYLIIIFCKLMKYLVNEFAPNKLHLKYIWMCLHSVISSCLGNESPISQKLPDLVEEQPQLPLGRYALYEGACSMLVLSSNANQILAMFLVIDSSPARHLLIPCLMLPLGEWFNILDEFLKCIFMINLTVCH